jgi:hypothetical protein
MKIRLLILNIFVLSSLVLSPLGAQAVGTASLSLSPSSGSHVKNSTFKVSIYENSGTTEVNTVQSYLSYETSSVQFVSVAPGSVFSTCTELSGGSGSIHVTCAALGGKITGSQLVGTITFKALASSGSSAVQFNSDSHIYASADNRDVWNGSTVGATYTFTAPPVASNPTPAVTTTNTYTTPTTVASTNQDDTTVPIAEEVTNQEVIAATDENSLVAPIQSTDENQNSWVYALVGLLGLMAAISIVQRKVILAKISSFYTGIKPKKVA